MADDDNKPDATTAPEPATAPEPEKAEPQVKTFTAEQVEDIVRSRLERDRKNRAKPEPKAPPKETKTSKPDEPDVSARLAKMETDLAFERALKKLGGNWGEDDEAILRTVFDADPDRLEAAAARLRPQEKAKEEDTVKETEKVDGTGQPSYKSPGAPQSPPEVLQQDASKWSREYVQRLVAEGRLLQEVKKYRDSLPGGANGLFRRPTPPK